MNLIDTLRVAVTALRKLGPYALLELLLPGGTILAFLLYLYRRRTNVDCGSTVCRCRIARSAALDSVDRA